MKVLQVITMMFAFAMAQMTFAGPAVMASAIAGAAVHPVVINSPAHTKGYPVLRVGVDPTLKPFVYMDSDGAIKGFDVDIANAVCFQLHRTCEFVSIPWDGLIPALKAKKVDALITAMSITKERDKVVDFSIPYYKSPDQLLTRKGIKSLSTGDRLGVLRGSTAETFANDTFAITGIKVVGYTNQQEAFLDLASGRIQAVLGPRIELQAGLIDGYPEGDQYHFIGRNYTDPAYFGPGIGMATREGDPLRDQLNQAIRDLRTNGIWQATSDSYFAGTGINIAAD